MYTLDMIKYIFYFLYVTYFINVDLLKKTIYTLDNINMKILKNI